MTEIYLKRVNWHQVKMVAYLYIVQIWSNISIYFYLCLCLSLLLWKVAASLAARSSTKMPHLTLSCLFFGAEQMLWWIFRAFHWKQLPAAAGNDAMRLLIVNQNNDVAACKDKTISWKMIKCYAELKETVIWFIVNIKILSRAAINTEQHT